MLAQKIKIQRSSDNPPRLSCQKKHASDTWGHSFLILMLKKFDFGQNFFNWIENLLKDQKSCIINGGKATPYFTLQSDPVLSILFILSLELLFPSIKKNLEILGIEIFDHFYFWSAYANYTTFFLKNQNSIRLFAKTFKIFCQFSGLKPNVSEWKIEGTSAFKGVPMAVWKASI